MVDINVDTAVKIPEQAVENRVISANNHPKSERINEALTRIQRLAGIGVLTASVAHELNTPLSIITATCSNLQHEVEDNSLSMAQLLKYIEMIEQSVWRAARTVEVLRNYSYDEERQTAVTDLNMIIEDALTLVRHQFQGEYNIRIQKELADDFKTIVCDHNGLTQVLINLLINARDAMLPDGGTVTVKSWVLPAGSRLNGSDDKKTAVETYAVSISDTGSGIDPAIMDKIYEPFFTTKPQGKGTGLGLYIARRIMKQHHGRIQASHNPDGGATFTIYLPRHKDTGQPLPIDY
ncbi:MAG: hypothetical protein HF973_07035 [Chloroflexi bacterium]|nr:hypothetical protein [Chloroflexota bacterium]